jgi:hypothetical protein
MHKDSLGNTVSPGDVLVQYGNGAMYSDKTLYFIDLWEFPKEPHEGQGIQYSIGGARNEFYWRWPSDSVKINFDDFPEEFRYSFYNGMSHLSTTIKKGTAKDLIQASDWQKRIVSRSDVERIERMQKIVINSVDDIIANLDLLCSPGPVPNSIMEQVFNAYNVEKSPVYNGEIGLSMINNSILYNAILEKLSQNK